MIRKGDILTIKPEWRDAGDEKFTWVARSDEEKGRLDISSIELAHWVIWPMQTVRADMVEQTGRRIEDPRKLSSDEVLMKAAYHRGAKRGSF